MEWDVHASHGGNPARPGRPFEKSSRGIPEVEAQKEGCSSPQSRLVTKFELLTAITGSRSHRFCDGNRVVALPTESNRWHIQARISRISRMTKQKTTSSSREAPASSLGHGRTT